MIYSQVYKDIAPQSREILQTFKLAPKFSQLSAELYRDIVARLKRITFKTWQVF